LSGRADTRGYNQPFARLSYIEGPAACPAVLRLPTVMKASKPSRCDPLSTGIVWSGYPLSGVDGFDQDERADECDEGGVVFCGLFASEGDALEPLQLAHGLLDARTALVEDPGKEAGHAARGASVRDDGTDTACTRSLPVAVRVVAFVCKRGTRLDVWSDVEQGLELPTVARLAAGQMECERLAIEIALEMDLGCESSARAAECLMRLPPLAPAAETCARTTVLSNI
jgi:hypothetical protein